jgi:predicted DNA-binding transcriptional regulator AlpA
VAEHHLDARAGEIAEAVGTAGNDDDLLDTKQVARMLGVSVDWVVNGRADQPTGHYGPPFIKLGDRLVRYRRDELRRWLDSRVRKTDW